MNYSDGIHNLSCSTCKTFIFQTNKATVECNYLQLNAIDISFIDKYFQKQKIHDYRYDLFCLKCNSKLAVYQSFGNGLKGNVIMLKNQIEVILPQNDLFQTLQKTKIDNYCMQIVTRRYRELDGMLKKEVSFLRSRILEFDQRTKNLFVVLNQIKKELNELVNEQKA